MDAAATAATGIDWQTVAVIVGTAIAGAGAFGAWLRRSTDRKRSEWRSEDRLEGWVGRDGRWHPGVIDITFGWEDAAGVFHPGTPAEIRELRRDFADHVADGHGAPIPK